MILLLFMLKGKEQLSQKRARVKFKELQSGDVLLSSETVHMLPLQNIFKEFGQLTIRDKHIQKEKRVSLQDDGSLGIKTYDLLTQSLIKTENVQDVERTMLVVTTDIQ